MTFENFAENKRSSMQESCTEKKGSGILKIADSIFLLNLINKILYFYIKIDNLSEIFWIYLLFRNYTCYHVVSFIHVHTYNQMIKFL